VSVRPLVSETVVADGARYRVSWFDPPFMPPLAETTQALGICFTADSEIVLVTWNDADWTLPGGTVAPGETLDRTLTREVREEACAQVTASRLLGFTRGRCVRGPEEGLVLVRSMWRAEVPLERWAPGSRSLTAAWCPPARRSGW
jgi:ADP-ribose pyrophosphatase YjhB (NUDIX family)